MKNLVSGILRQHGTDMMLLHNGREITVRGFFQPVRSKSWQNVVHESTPIGEVVRRRYVYIGPPDVEPRELDILALGNRYYSVRRVEKYYYNNQPVYTWALCVEKGADDHWGV